MTQDEKDRLIEFFDDEKRWCRGTDAADRRGQVVHYDDAQAVSWDIVGGLCHLFGWKRASRLFEPISRQLTRKHHTAAPLENQEIAAMSVLLDFNDDDSTTHELMMSRLRELPVWHRIRSSA
jgi:hypothetical protein